jgi:hypothetical protein
MSLSTTENAASKAALTFLPIPTHGRDPMEHAGLLHMAVCETMQLAFTKEDLDLSEEQAYAFHLLTGLLADLCVITRNDPKEAANG